MMDAQKAGIYLARIIGYIIMMISLYQLGGIWWSLLASGIIAWMPMKWLK